MQLYCELDFQSFFTNIPYAEAVEGAASGRSLGFQGHETDNSKGPTVTDACSHL